MKFRRSQKLYNSCTRSAHYKPIYKWNSVLKNNYLNLCWITFKRLLKSIIQGILHQKTLHLWKMLTVRQMEKILWYTICEDMRHIINNVETDLTAFNRIKVKYRVIEHFLTQFSPMSHFYIPWKPMVFWRFQGV